MGARQHNLGGSRSRAANPADSRRLQNVGGSVVGQRGRPEGEAPEGAPLLDGVGQDGGRQRRIRRKGQETVIDDRFDAVRHQLQQSMQEDKPGGRTRTGVGQAVLAETEELVGKVNDL